MTCDWVEQELDIFPTRPYDPLECDDETKKVYREEIIPYWRGKTLNEIWHQRAKSVAPDAYKVGVGTGISEQGIIANMTVNHIIPDFRRVMEKGFLGIRKDIARKMNVLRPTDTDYFEKATFYKALLTVCDGAAKFGKRYAALARTLAKKESDPQLKADYLKVAEVCDRVPAEPARTFHEALQALYAAYSCSLNEACAVGFGRLDQYLYPYFKKDIEEGIITREEAQELLDCFYIKCSERQLFFSSDAAKYSVGARGTHTICVGGVDENGFDATNEVSYMLLQAMCNVRLGQPSILVLWHANMPEDLAIKACQLVSLGTGHPAIYSMDRLIEMLQELGLPLKEARKGTIVGCVEPAAEPGKSDNHSDAGHVNLVAALEFALNKGVWRINNEQMGYPTEDPRTFASFDQVMAAFSKQLECLVGHHVTLGQIARNLHEEMDPDPFADLLFEDCIERGLDIHSGGAKYSFGPGILFTGVADLINSMAAIKYLVFDQKVLTWDELLKALENNFEGSRGEEIRQMCLNAPKYGNGDPYVDSIGRELMRLPGEETAKYRSKRGAPWRASIIPLTAIFPLGMVTGALPSGRKAGLPLAEGCSPKQGTDTKGPTAVIRSVTSLDHSRFLNGTQLNLKFSPAVLKDRWGIMNLVTLLKTFISRGGYHVQINVVSKETLMDAQQHPEEYRGLTVRVSGYNAYFTVLTKEMQDDIIARTEHTMAM
jgi:pyruvate formate-lyase/glycerol dehydratase family glycyl radical enzyme